MAENPQDGVGRSSDPTAARLADELYHELRALAGFQLRGERRNHTLSTTALVNEAYVRLAAGGDRPLDLSSFLPAAAQAMRRVLIDHARRRGAAKRGGGWNRLVESVEQLAEDADEAVILELDAALARLGVEDARAAAVVRMRFYAGASVAQTAEALGIARRSVMRDWEYARAFLLAALREPG